MPVTWAGDDQGGWLVLGFDSIGLDDLAPARRWAEDQLADLGEEHRTDTVLVVAELLDNAFLHVGGRVRLRLRLDADPCETTVAVADEGAASHGCVIPTAKAAAGCCWSTGSARPGESVTTTTARSCGACSAARSPASPVRRHPPAAPAGHPSGVHFPRCRRSLRTLAVRWSIADVHRGACSADRCTRPGRPFPTTRPTGGHLPRPAAPRSDNW